MPLQRVEALAGLRAKFRRAVPWGANHQCAVRRERCGAVTTNAPSGENAADVTQFWVITNVPSGENAADVTQF